PVEESVQVPLDSREVVLVAAIERDVRPFARVLVAPRIVREKRDLRRRVSEAQRVVQKKVVQLVRPDGRLGVVGRVAVVRSAGNQLGGERIVMYLVVHMW